MDLHQLETFVAVAREGSITRASERLHLSQPAVSAHVKTMEDALGLTLFARTARGMSLTPDGQRLLAKAEETLAAHRELLVEATRIKGTLTGRLRLGARSNSNLPAVGTLLTRLSKSCPDVEVTLAHGTSLEILAGLRNGSLDAGFYNEGAEPEGDLAVTQVSDFKIYLAARPDFVAVSTPPDWRRLAELPWIYPASSACCGRAAENLFKNNRLRPQRILSVDREEVTRTLVASGTGIGLLHADTARAAAASGEVELLFEVPDAVRVLFAHLARRAGDPLLQAARAALTNG